MAQVRFRFARNDSRTADNRREALAFGKRGEEMAARYLEDKGYIIIERNYRKGHLEIDLIALDGDELVVVEVKTRSGDVVAEPEEAIGHKKRLSLIRLANQYARSLGRTENIRLDVVAIISNENGTEFNHIKNAFNVMRF